MAVITDAPFAFKNGRATTFDETVILMMPLKYLAYLSVIAFLAACAPVEPKPVVTAPLPKAPQDTPQQTPEKMPEEMPEKMPEETTQETPAKEIAPVETVSDTQAGEELPVEKLTGEELPVEKLAGEKLAGDNARKITDPIIAEAPKEEPAPPPPPPPYDPVTLIGESLQDVQSLFGTADLRFENGGLTISHYRQDDCIMLVFSQKTDAALITHIDLRASQLGTALDTAVCHQALGLKKHANQ